MSYVCDIRNIEFPVMNKKEVFDKKLQELATLAKVISHPARLAILQLLSESKTCISGDISDSLPLSRTTVSQHLQELKKAELITGEVEGLKINYCLNRSAIGKFKKLFDDFFQEESCCANIQGKNENLNKMKAEDLKLIVKEKYGAIASQGNAQNQDSCCGGSDCCGDTSYSIFSDDYTELQGYNPDADLGLGCGLPTEYAGIKEGDHVLDLGSGAGNDCFVARTLLGESGHVTGLDFTDEMLEKANSNLQKTGFKNIDFIKGDIENIPLKNNSFDVVISNCVLNLVPDKQKAFGEIYRTLKPGGHFCISDVVLTGELPGKLQQAAEMYAGCVSGAMLKEDYLEVIAQQGFKNIEVKKEKEIEIPNSILLKYITLDELRILKRDGIGVYSVTVNGTKG